MGSSGVPSSTVRARSVAAGPAGGSAGWITWAAYGARAKGRERGADQRRPRRGLAG